MVLVDIGKVEARAAAGRAGAGGDLHPRQRLQVLRRVGGPQGFRGPQVTLSRTHPNLVRKLFALEVPEIADGSVEIVAVAREAGHRSKIAVRTDGAGVNAKGACIGPMGAAGAQRHERAARREDRHHRLVRRPGDLRRQRAVPGAGDCGRRSSTPRARAARVVVPDFQLSLAIGKEGQNARLAARLTGWRIDIRSDADPETRPVSRRVGRASARVAADPGSVTGNAAERARR